LQKSLVRVQYRPPMASQVAHIVYAGKYLEKFPTENTDEFLLGVCFPDIRRIDPKIKRSDTHIILNDLNPDLRYLEPFQAGWKFHLYCDMRREEILNDFDFYSLANTTGFEGIANKLLEDELIYDSYKNWEKIIGLFNKPPEIKLPNFVTPASTHEDCSSTRGGRETFEVWCAILAKYFEKKPSAETMRIFLCKQPKLVSIAKDIIDSVDKLRKNDKVIELLIRVKDEIIRGI
jgi:hypothetical protein